MVDQIIYNGRYNSVVVGRGKSNYVTESDTVEPIGNKLANNRDRDQFELRLGKKLFI